VTDYFDLHLEDAELLGITNLALAHIGDAVYELMVRSFLCLHGGVTSKGLHSAAIKHVSAPAQAHAFTLIENVLTPDELAVYKRGRNAHVNSVPHGATPGQYHSATGLETLFGWLYLRGEKDRLCELFTAIMGETDGN